MYRSIVAVTAIAALLLLPGTGCGESPPDAGSGSGAAEGGTVDSGSPRSATTSDAEAVWAAERAYWRAIQERDLEAYLALWHPDATVWPPSADAPVDVDALRETLSERPWNFDSYSFEITPRAARVVGDVAVVHYTIVERGSLSGGRGFLNASRVTRTWIRDGDRWSILGGTSVPEDLEDHRHGDEPTDEGSPGTDDSSR